MPSKRLTIWREAGRRTSTASCKEVLPWLRVADPAVITAVSEINHQADHQPDDEPGPVHPPELVHHVAVEQDSKNWYDRHPWCTEGARLIGVGVAQNHDGDAYNHEGQQRPDVDHLSDVIDWCHAANDGCQQTNKHGVLVRCAEFRMDCRKEFLRQEAVVGHRVEHARL